VVWNSSKIGIYQVSAAHCDFGFRKYDLIWESLERYLNYATDSFDASVPSPTTNHLMQKFSGPVALGILALLSTAFSTKAGERTEFLRAALKGADRIEVREVEPRPWGVPKKPVDFKDAAMIADLISKLEFNEDGTTESNGGRRIAKLFCRRR
jgi:hypothetical protein